TAQHSFDIGPRQTFIYGGDYSWTNPRTGGTIDGRNEGADDTREVGAYLHSVTKLTPRWELVSALRADNNDRVDGTAISPRVAVVFKPSANRNVRVSYNRAYGTPSSFSMFLDLVQAHN